MDIGIVAVVHKSRKSRVPELEKSAKVEAIAYDPGHVGCEQNHICAWEYLSRVDCDWGVVLEDDALPVTNFNQQLRQVLSVAPHPVVSLYLGRSRPPQYQSSIAQVIGLDTHFIESKTLLNCVGLCVRGDYLRQLATYCRKYYDGEQRRVKKGSIDALDCTPIDEMISSWTETETPGVVYTNPSLVDHAQLPTTIPYHLSRHKEEDMVSRKEVRRAWRVGTRKDWSGTSIVRLPEPGEIVTTTVNR